MNVLKVIRKSHVPAGKLPAGYVFVLDDDARLSPRWTEAYQKFFQAHGQTGWDVALLSGGSLTDPTGKVAVRSSAFLIHSSSATHILHALFKPRVGILPVPEALRQAVEKNRLKVVVPDEAIFFTDSRTSR